MYKENGGKCLSSHEHTDFQILCNAVGHFDITFPELYHNSHKIILLELIGHLVSLLSQVIYLIENLVWIFVKRHDKIEEEKRRRISIRK